jgi:class 3 adenylate cyclase
VFRPYNAEHADEPILVRIGLHTGEALREKDKFFGLTVILAARIAGQAQGGKVLASSLVKQLTESGSEVRFGPSRQASLKGISEAQALHSVEWQ